MPGRAAARQEQEARQGDGLVRRPVKDYYQALGVAPDASAQQIKERFRDLARRLHPDANPGDRESAERFKEIAEAWDVLSSPERRQQHDASMRSLDLTRQAREDGLLDGLLDGMLGEREPDGQVCVTFDEALRGATAVADIPGLGPVPAWVPPGTWDGAMVRGAPSPAGRQPRIRVQVLEHPVFRLDEDGVHADLALSLAEAILGGDVQAVTPGGPAWVRVPPGSQAGQGLALPGLVPCGDGCLDLLLTVRVHVPRHLGSQAQELLRQFDDACPPAAQQARQEALRLLRQGCASDAP